MPTRIFSQSGNNNTNSTADNTIAKPETIATGLNIPWELVFLPSGEMLVTERPGNLLLMVDRKMIPIPREET
jgi:glucose/arabinose dehydrogenase